MHKPFGHDSIFRSRSKCFCSLQGLMLGVGSVSASWFLSLALCTPLRLVPAGKRRREKKRRGKGSRFYYCFVLGFLDLASRMGFSPSILVFML
jgi:hypothetical protein